MGKPDWSQLGNNRVQVAQSPVNFPGQFLDERPTFEPASEHQQPCEEPAELDDPVRTIAEVVKIEFDKQLALSNSASTHVAERQQTVLPANTVAQKQQQRHPQRLSQLIL